MACTTNALDLLFLYRPLSAHASIRLYVTSHHAHCPVGVGFSASRLTVVALKEGQRLYLFGRTTPRHPRDHHIPLSDLQAARYYGYHMSSFCDAAGYIHFPHCLCCCQDAHMLLQPTDKCGDLTFTEALIVPTDAERSGALPTASVVNRLCSDQGSGNTNRTLSL